MSLLKTDETLEVGELLDTVALDRNGIIVTTEGALVRIVEVTPLNPRVMGDEKAQRVVKGFGQMCNRLKPGQSLQFYVEGWPLLLPDVKKEMRREVDKALEHQPPERQDAMRRLARAHERSLEDHSAERAVVDFRAYVVVPFLPPSKATQVDWSQFLPGKRRLPGAPLSRGLEDHQRALRQSLVHTEAIMGDLGALGIATHPLDGVEIYDLLYRRFNPSSVESGYRPRLVVLGTLDEVADATSAAAAAQRLREEIAQSPMDLSDGRMIGVENCLERVHYVSRQPDAVEFGMFLEAMEVERPFIFTMHVHGLDRLKESQRINQKRTQLHGLNKGNQERGKSPSLKRKAKGKETKRVYKQLTSSEGHKLFDVSIYQLIREPGPLPDKNRLLEGAATAVDAVRGAGDANVQVGGFKQEQLWKTTLPLARDVVAKTRKHGTRHVGCMTPLIGPSCGSRTGPPMFYSRGVRTLLRFNPWGRERLNGLMVVNGDQGTGKTMLGITMAGRFLPHGVPVTVMDRSGGHWEFLTRLVPDAAHLSVGGPRSDVSICPWDVPDLLEVTDEKVRFLLALHEIMLGGNISDEGKNLLIEGIQAVYARCAVEGRMPLERDLKLELERLSKEAQMAAGDRLTKRAEDLSSLATRLTRYVAPGPDAFLADCPTTVHSDAPLVVFDMKHVGAHLPAVLFIVFEHTIAKVERRRLERLERGGEKLLLPGSMLVSEEMWKVMEHPSTGQYVNDVSRRSRHLGLFFLASTQYFTDWNNPHGQALLDSAHMKLFLQQSREQLKVVQGALRLSDNEVDQIENLQTIKGRSAQAFIMNGAWGSGVVDLLFGGLEYWYATTDPIDDVPLRERVLRECNGDAWAALEKLAAMEGVR